LDLRVVDSITNVPEAEWDALAAAPVDPGYAATPFIRWAFIEALEASGCAAPRASQSATSA
jgi:predicted N-acyltransferase